MSKRDKFIENGRVILLLYVVFCPLVWWMAVHMQDGPNGETAAWKFSALSDEHVPFDGALANQHHTKWQECPLKGTSDLRT